MLKGPDVMAPEGCTVADEVGDVGASVGCAAGRLDAAIRPQANRLRNRMMRNGAYRKIINTPAFAGLSMAGREIARRDAATPSLLPSLPMMPSRLVVHVDHDPPADLARKYFRRELGDFVESGNDGQRFELI